MQEAIEKKVQVMQISLSTTYLTKCINSYFQDQLVKEIMTLNSKLEETTEKKVRSYVFMYLYLPENVHTYVCIKMVFFTALRVHI